MESILNSMFWNIHNNCSRVRVRLGLPGSAWVRPGPSGSTWVCRSARVRPGLPGSARVRPGPPRSIQVQGNRKQMKFWKCPKEERRRRKKKKVGTRSRLKVLRIKDFACYRLKDLKQMINFPCYPSKYDLKIESVQVPNRLVSKEYYQIYFSTNYPSSWTFKLVLSDRYRLDLFTCSSFVRNISHMVLYWINFFYV